MSHVLEGHIIAGPVGSWGVGRSSYVVTYDDTDLCRWHQ